MSLELKIKASTLAFEAAAIRRIERKLKRMRNYRVKLDNGGPLEADVTLDRAMQLRPGSNPVGYERWGRTKMLSLKAHRRFDVRREARRTHLARMFLRGRDYQQVEQKVHVGNVLTAADWVSISRMIERYARIDAFGARGFTNEQAVAQQFEEWKQAAEAHIDLTTP